MTDIHVATYIIYIIAWLIIIVILYNLSRHLFSSNLCSSSNNHRGSGTNRHHHSNRDGSNRRNSRDFTSPSSHNRQPSFSQSIDDYNIRSPAMDNTINGGADLARLDNVIGAAAQQPHIPRPMTETLPDIGTDLGRIDTNPSSHLQLTLNGAPSTPVDTSSDLMKGHSSTVSHTGTHTNTGTNITKTQSVTVSGTTPTRTTSTKSSTRSSKKRQNKMSMIDEDNEKDIGNTLNVNNNHDDIEKSRSNTITKSGQSRSSNRRLSTLMQQKLPISITNAIGKIKKMSREPHDPSDIHLVVRLSSLIACFGFFLCVTMICIYFLLESVSSKHKDNPEFNPENAYGDRALFSLKAMGFIFYGIAKFSLYICSGSRLFYSFDNSVVQYNIKIYTMISLLLIMDFVVILIAIVSLYKNSYKSFTISMIIFYIMDILYLVTLYILFTKQLVTLVKKTNNYAQSSSSSSTNNTQKSSAPNTPKSKAKSNIESSIKNSKQKETEIELQISSPTSSPTSDINSNSNPTDEINIDDNDIDNIETKEDEDEDNEHRNKANDEIDLDIVPELAGNLGTKTRKSVDRSKMMSPKSAKDEQFEQKRHKYIHNHNSLGMSCFNINFQSGHIQYDVKRVMYHLLMSIILYVTCHVYLSYDNIYVYIIVFICVSIINRDQICNKIQRNNILVCIILIINAYCNINIRQ